MLNTHKKTQLRCVGRCENIPGGCSTLTDAVKGIQRILDLDLDEITENTVEQVSRSTTFEILRRQSRTWSDPCLMIISKRLREQPGGSRTTRQVLARDAHKQMETTSGMNSIQMINESESSHFFAVWSSKHSFRNVLPCVRCILVACGRMDGCRTVLHWLCHGHVIPFWRRRQSIAKGPCT